jgi:uncharacterized protein YbaR (Trm112 family)
VQGRVIPILVDKVVKLGWFNKLTTNGPNSQPSPGELVLELKVETEEGDEVIKGSLLCSRCNEPYPIDDAIPNLLPPQMRT